MNCCQFIYVYTVRSDFVSRAGYGIINDIIYGIVPYNCFAAYFPLDPPWQGEN